MNEPEPTERAMSEGNEVRELLVEQLRLMLGPMLEERRTPNTAENAVDVYCDVVAGVVLAVLRPHLGLGVTLTAEEIENITYILDWYFTDAKKRARPEQLAAIDAFKRWARTSAIAGRGEG